ncbi:MAG: glutamate 2,3-aminomutase [Firmicutes bacterium]|nr:glutamate 2,3-aminomutase [Bacillota bacterium]MDD3297501.1 glutamate 2,3-aminomutase [Bacillota bacterium]MDD3851067.1 glutamate 2,3-aminomutase [Bacillota bacterium]MDD4706897.1 glutamate 2,3-aminomutase [Bacillota bacterium]
MSASNKSSRQISLERAGVLKSRIDPYLDAKMKIPTGLEQKEAVKARQAKIKEALGASDADWNDWQWQIDNRITDSETLAKFITLTPKQKKDIDAVASKFRWAISPYFLSLIEPEGDHYKNAIYLQSIPTGLELKEGIGSPDPMAEEFTNPAPCITRRYPDRLIINVTNQCGMYCRHCQRRRNIGELDKPQPKENMQQAVDYIRNTPEIRDVLVTGGDPFTLSNEMLDWLLGELDSIPHLEFKRIGTRMPVTLPQRVTPELCEMLKKHHPLFINLQFNNPMEVSEDSKKACEMLANAGIPLGNQAVLLRGVNDHPFVMKKLCQELLRIRVRPYYIFHAKGVVGTLHFRTSVDIGIEIMEHLRGYTSGLAIPTFIINAPEGRGKTPMLPEYVISHGRDTITIRTWEGQIIEYPNKDADIQYE